MAAIKPVEKQIFELRWRFEYNDGTPPKIGMWSYASQKLEEMASFQKRTNIARAFVESKDKRSGEIRKIVNCTGQEYCLFKWVCGVKVGFNPNAVGTRIISGDVIGLMLVSRKVQATIWVNGSPPKIEVRTEEDKNFNYKGY